MDWNGKAVCGLERESGVWIGTGRGPEMWLRSVSSGSTAIIACTYLSHMRRGISTIILVKEQQRVLPDISPRELWRGERPVVQAPNTNYRSEFAYYFATERRSHAGAGRDAVNVEVASAAYRYKRAASAAAAAAAAAAATDTVLADSEPL